MQSIFSVTVTRLCRIRSGAVDDELAFRLDADGFLDVDAAGPANGATDDPAGQLMPLSAALRSGAVVLLGEPGLGKSTEFKRLRDIACLLSPPVEVDAAEITDAAAFEELVGRHIRALPVRQTTDVEPIIPKSRYHDLWAVQLIRRRQQMRALARLTNASWMSRRRSHRTARRRNWCSRPKVCSTT